MRRIHKLGLGLIVAGGGLLAARALSGGHKHAGGLAPGYPPLDTPKPAAEGIWIVDSIMEKATVSFPVRMTVLRLSSGDLLLHSPTRFTPALGQELGKLGRVGYLVAPNTAHWSFVQEWQAAFPEAQTWAAPGLRDRRQVRRSALRIDRDLGLRAPSAWEDDISQGVVEGGAGFCEVWLYHRPSKTLVLTDLIENFDQDRLGSATAALLRLMRATEGTTPRHLRAILRLGGASTKQQLRRLTALEPERVIFGHGEWFAHDGAERLARAFDWLG